jgi:uncharacterized protein (TIGR02118 family)
MKTGACRRQCVSLGKSDHLVLAGRLACTLRSKLPELGINRSRQALRLFLILCQGTLAARHGRPRLAFESSHSMLKFVYTVRRHPSLSAEEFRKYWLEKHGPLVRSFAEKLHARRYVQSHTIDSPLNVYAQQPRGTKPPYDGLTEIWWDRAEDLIAALSTPEGQQINQALTQDEARFCDLPNCSVFFTEEHTIFDR